MRPIIHMVLHFIVPALVARTFYLDRWRWAFLIMVGTMVVDIDHLLADPIYDPHRCGIGFHPLHSYPAIAVYLFLLGIPKLNQSNQLSPLRLISLGLVIHMFLDGTDCLWLQLE